MATVGIKLAKQLAEGNGYYLDDPRVVRIVEYTDMGGKQAYGIEYEHELGKYSASQWGERAQGVLGSRGLTRQRTREERRDG